MKIDKPTANAFIAIDLQGAPCSTGIVRAARKILQGGAKNLARTTTYTFAARELQVGGASAGISAEGDAVEAAIADFVTAVTPRVESGELAFDAGKGVTGEALSALSSIDKRSTLRHETFEGFPLATYLVAISAVASAEAAMGALEGKTAIVEEGPNTAAITAVLAAYGIPSVETDPSKEVDLFFTASNDGRLDGETAGVLSAKAVIPTGPHALGAKGLAVLRRREIVAVPDFIATAGSSFAGWPGDAANAADAVEATKKFVQGFMADVVSHEDGPVLAACYKAEAFLATWQETLPFGRPLA
ncbi:MAG: hypothetical protein WC184_04070 [Acidimicrobiia bacterium]